ILFIPQKNRAKYIEIFDIHIDTIVVSFVIISIKNLKNEVVYEFEEKLDKEYSTFFNRKTEFIKLRNNSEIGSNHNNNELSELMSEIEETKELNEFIANLIKYVHNEYSEQLLPDELHQIKISKILKQKYHCKKLWKRFILCWNYFALDHQQLRYGYQNIPIEQFCIIDSNANYSRFNIYQIIRLLEQQQNEFFKKFEQFKSQHIQIIEEKKEDPLPQHTCKYFFGITKDDILCFNKAKLD
ncbi:hypothetical protein RFI_22491, partial [Reticulomyxa filosa]